MKVIVSGSRSIKQLPQQAIASLDKIILLNFAVIVGDAYGVDVLVQKYLKSKQYENVTVYYATFGGSGKPRNTNGFNTVGVPGNYIDRDKKMCEIANFGLAIWDGKSKGTRENIERVKKTRVIEV